MKYFEIKSDTREYNLANKIYTSHAEWSKKEVFDDLEKAIGIPITSNLECTPYVLRLHEMPEGTREQFKSKLIQGKHEAKMSSDLNRRYLEVVKKHNLISYGMTEFALESRMFELIHALIPIKTKDGLRFFVEEKENISEEGHKKLSGYPFLVEFKESEYLQVRVEMLKEKEKREQSSPVV